MNYQTQLKLIAASLTPVMSLVLGYKYTVFHGNFLSI